MPNRFKHLVSVSIFILIANLIFDLTGGLKFQVKVVVVEIVLYVSILFLFDFVRLLGRQLALKKQNPDVTTVPYAIKLKYALLFFVIGVVIGFIIAIPSAGVAIFLGFFLMGIPALSQAVFVAFLLVPYAVPVIAFILGYVYGEIKGRDVLNSKSK